jgi:hypothetical protein
MILIGSSDIFQGLIHQPQRLQGFVRWQLQWQAPFWARISVSGFMQHGMPLEHLAVQPTGRASTHLNSAKNQSRLVQ